MAIDPRDGSGWYVQTFGGTGVKRSSAGVSLTVVPGFTTPLSVDVDPADGSVWVADADFSAGTAGSIVKLDQNGHELLRISLPSPAYVARVNPDDGSVWVGVDGAVIVVSSTGQILKRVEGFSVPRDIGVVRVTEPTHTLASITEFSGTARGIGQGDDQARLQIVGRFTSATDLDLGASTRSITPRATSAFGSRSPGRPSTCPPSARRRI